MVGFNTWSVLKKTKTKKNTFNFIDLFSGAGGFSCGLEMSGMHCLLGVDYDHHAMETFAANHPNSQHKCTRIQELTNKKLKLLLGNQKVNLVVGGPPCQGFSTVGPGNPEDERNSLFLEFFRIVKFLKPEFVVIENVTGLLAKKNEETLLNIFKVFNKIGYTMDARVLESQHYGVPEKRRRTIIIGSRVNSQIDYPKIINDGVKIPFTTVGEALRDIKTKTGKPLNHDLEAAKPKNDLELERIKCIPMGKSIRYPEDEKKYFKKKKLKLGIDWSKTREGRLRQAKYFRLNRKLPSPTIMTHRHTYFHPSQNRYLTQREAARLQSFPNHFEFKGPLSKQWRQIGNAVPPLMAKSIGKSIFKMFKASKKENLVKTSSKQIRDTEQIENLRSNAFLYKKSS